MTEQRQIHFFQKLEEVYVEMNSAFGKLVALIAEHHELPPILRDTLDCAETQGDRSCQTLSNLIDEFTMMWLSTHRCTCALDHTMCEHQP
jgi:hypothetical protein